ncbi:uncharacterized protein LOC133192357 [Saccostrea echinata]|uniref:uncharacterized protein LOC133192357 n=1 Tax=Saccostrea echinata TaxID=191078 RepID=UPI002A81D7C8|nr:uncharacterized protein LOC133192357 [Saccostrea echinata]
MDPDKHAKNLIRCDLCETETVQVNCETCHVRLCNSCIGEHMTSDASKNKHEIVRFTFQKSIPLYPLCAFHDKEHCEMYCDDCNIPVCITCITSYQHSGHKFLKLLQVLDERKKQIVKEQNELNKVIYPKYHEIASNVEYMIKEVKKKYDDVSITITKHGKEWHREIDKVVTKLTSEVDEMKTKQLKILRRHLDEIHVKISEIRNEIDSNDVDVTTMDVSELLSFKLNVEKFRNPPQKLMLPLPKFTPGKIQDLCSMFGTLSSGKLSSEIITTINTEYERCLNNVACLSDKKIWTSGDENTIKLYSINQGSLLKSITTKSRCTPYDIAVTKHGYLVYTDPSDRTVNIVKNEEIKTIIKLQHWSPGNICSTSSGDFLVIMTNIMIPSISKIVRYSGSTEKQTINSDKKSLLFLSTDTKYICENRNLDICVADYGAKAVLVFSKAGLLRFRYTGPKDQLCRPRGITTDSQSHILTTDSYHDSVHILDQDGQFLHYIECGLSIPSALCIDANNSLFVVQQKNNQVKKLKYLQ